MLAERDKDLVKTSFAKIRPRGDNFTRDFYHRFFKAAPEARALFAENMTKQAVMLGKTLAYLVATLDKFDELVEPLQKLGARHAEYGAQPEHYDILAEVLIQTLARHLQKDWTPEHEQAWSGVLTLVARTMISGAEIQGNKATG